MIDNKNNLNFLIENLGNQQGNKNTTKAFIDKSMATPYKYYLGGFIEGEGSNSVSISVII